MDRRHVSLMSDQALLSEAEVELDIAVRMGEDLTEDLIHNPLGVADSEYMKRQTLMAQHVRVSQAFSMLVLARKEVRK